MKTPTAPSLSWRYSLSQMFDRAPELFRTQTRQPDLKGQPSQLFCWWWSVFLMKSLGSLWGPTLNTPLPTY